MLDLDFDTNDLIVMAPLLALFLLQVASEELRAWTWVLLKRSMSFMARIFSSSVVTHTHTHDVFKVLGERT